MQLEELVKPSLRSNVSVTEAYRHFHQEWKEDMKWENPGLTGRLVWNAGAHLRSSSPLLSISVSSDQPLLHLPWSCVSTWTGIHWRWSGDPAGTEGPVGCCPYSSDGLAKKQQGAGADRCLPAHELGAVSLCLPNIWISLGHSHDPGKNWETSFCLNSLTQCIPSLTEKTKRENTNCQYQHWERGHVDFIDTYKKKLSLICCLPPEFPSCVCSLEKGLH